MSAPVRSIIADIFGDVTALAAAWLSADAAGRARIAAGFFNETTATSAFAAGAITGALLKAGALSADATGRAIMADDYFTEAAATDKFVAGAIAGSLLKDAGVVNAKLGAAAVTGTKLAATGITSGSFDGRNGAGVCTLTGAAVGQRVLALFRIDAAAGALATGQSAAFEATITVAGQIQQSSASDLSTQDFVVILMPVAA